MSISLKISYKTLLRRWLSPRRGTVIVFLANRWSRSMEQRFSRLRAECAPAFRCVLMLDARDAQVVARWTEFLSSINALDALEIFRIEAVCAELGYSSLHADSVVPGSAHFSLIAYARRNPWAYYWAVEYDVEYRGHWGEFFKSYTDSRAHLIASHCQRPEDLPEWCWWDRDLAEPGGSKPSRQGLRKAFMPLYRISASALSAVDAAHRDGWRGHVECLAPTILHQKGYLVSDFNQGRRCSYRGDSQDPIPDNERLSTLRWGPHVEREEFLGRDRDHSLAFHPVKGDWHYDGSNIVSFENVPETLPETSAVMIADVEIT